MNWKVLAGTLPFVIGLIVLLASGFGKDPFALPMAMVGKPAPRFILQTLDGKREVDLAALKGKTVVVNFWATWCVPCWQEHAALQDAAKRHDPAEVVFLGVVYEDSRDEAQEYLQKKGSAYENLFDPGTRAAISYGVGGVPESYFVSPGGMIVEKFNGPLDAQSIDSLVARSQRDGGAR
ncbi:MAG: redoxin domain-containing protein [Candidatus Schekmanbacteria bacterium]|nr:redoxin domain-containing protein [Candidatus Schekmanbacteria bacterium]